MSSPLLSCLLGIDCLGINVVLIVGNSVFLNESTQCNVDSRVELHSRTKSSQCSTLILKVVSAGTTSRVVRIHVSEHVVLITTSLVHVRQLDSPL